MIKIFIFDLDDTLIDTTGLIIPQAVQASCEILLQGGVNASLALLIEERKNLALQMSHQKIFPFLIQKYGLTNPDTDQKDLAEKAVECFYRPKISPGLPTMDGALQILKDLQNKCAVYLVTSGIPEVQLSKVKSAQLEPYFKQIFLMDSFQNQRKKIAFEKILALENISPEKCLSIGNRLSSEIRDAKLCGMQTCYFKYGEHVGELPESLEEEPDFTIQNHQQLRNLCQIP